MSEVPVTNRPLAVLRAMIDSIDRDVLQLLARRMALVGEIAGYKREHTIAIRDYAREKDVLDDRCGRAEKLGLPREEIEDIYRLILLTSRDYQASLRAELPLKIEPKGVAIIGGHGGMGSLFARMFRDLGQAVMIADLDTDLTPAEAAQDADVVVISVPIDVTEQVIRELGPHVRPDALLMDVTSLKQKPMEAMLSCTKAAVIGTHPMFGPGVHTLQGQRVVVCSGRGDDWLIWLKNMLSARGLLITETTPQTHDRAMAIVQVLTHFNTQVWGWTLAKLGVPLEETLPFTSPSYLMELYMAARHFAQSPVLYGPIEMFNPQTETITKSFQSAARELADVLASGDQARFTGMFDEVRDFFGSFSEEALEQSRFLIDRLVERL